MRQDVMRQTAIFRAWTGLRAARCLSQPSRLLQASAERRGVERLAAQAEKNASGDKGYDAPRDRQSPERSHGADGMLGFGRAAPGAFSKPQRQNRPRGARIVERRPERRKGGFKPLAGLWRAPNDRGDPFLDDKKRVNERAVLFSPRAKFSLTSQQTIRARPSRMRKAKWSQWPQCGQRSRSTRRCAAHTQRSASIQSART
jgi:hypothetical protein